MLSELQLVIENQKRAKRFFKLLQFHQVFKQAHVRVKQMLLQQTIKMRTAFNITMMKIRMRSQLRKFRPTLQQRNH